MWRPEKLVTDPGRSESGRGAADLVKRVNNQGTLKVSYPNFYQLVVSVCKMLDDSTANMLVDSSSSASTNGLLSRIKYRPIVCVASWNRYTPAVHPNLQNLLLLIDVNSTRYLRSEELICMSVPSSQGKVSDPCLRDRPPGDTNEPPTGIT